MFLRNLFKGKKYINLLTLPLLLGYHTSHGNLNYETIYEIPLYQACIQGDLETVKNLIEKKSINPNKFELALHYACDKSDGNLDVVKYLVETCHFNPSSTPECKNHEYYQHCCCEIEAEYYPTPLFYAFKSGNSEVVNYLIPKMEINVYSSTEDEYQQALEIILNLTHLNRIRQKIKTLLENENIEELRNFIDKKIKLKEFVESYNTKIQKLTYSHVLLDELDISQVDRLCQEYLGTSYRFGFLKDDISALLPLKIACEKTSLSLLRFLIEEQNFEPQYHLCHENYSILYPLILYHRCDKSSKCKLLDCIKYLVEICHVDPTETAWGKLTLLHAICEASHVCCSSSYKAIDYFIEKGIPISAQDKYEDTPLDKAVKADKFEIVKYLVEKYNAMINIEKTILFNVNIFPPNLNLIHYLITYGARPDIIQNKIGNFLHKACSFGSLELVKMLIEEFGMDIYATVDGETSQDIAKREAELPYFDPCGHQSKTEFENERKKYSKIAEYLENKKSNYPPKEFILSQ